MSEAGANTYREVTPAPSATPSITLFSRPGCHLCDDARAALGRVRAGVSFELVELDITRDEGLHRRYLERIPVVLLDGEEIFEFFVDEQALRAVLLGERGRTPAESAGGGSIRHSALESPVSDGRAGGDSLESDR